jgi:hypothetical protein
LKLIGEQHAAIFLLYDLVDDENGRRAYFPGYSRRTFRQRREEGAQNENTYVYM